MKAIKCILAALVVTLAASTAQAALTAARQTKSKNPGAIKSYLMKASTTIYAGGLVMIDSNGVALPAAASASNHGVVGVAMTTKTSAASGTYLIEVQEGWFLFVGTSLSQGDVGHLVYASNDFTVDETQGANQPIAGLLIEYVSATSGWVWASPVWTTRPMVSADPLSLTDDLTLSGGASALTFTDSASSVVLNDNDTTALLIGSTGQLGLITVDTGNATETVQINGTTTVKAFEVAVGTSTFAEPVTLSGGAGALTCTSSSASILLNDNDSSALDIGSAGATALMRFDTSDAGGNVTVTGGLTVTGSITPTGGLGTLTVANGANAACTATCAAKTCIIGFDAGASAFVACATATADTCICSP